MFWHIARQTPALLGVVLVAMLYRATSTAWPPLHRAAHALWVGWVLWFGVIDSGITTNYLLLPVTLMLIAIAIDLSVIKRVPLALAVATLLVFDQWRLTSLEAARPTIHVPEIAELRESLQPNDRVVCTDELGCLMLVGRIDRWLALDDFVRERFLVRRGNDTAVGVYTGAPALFRPGDLFSPNADGTLPDRVIVVDVFKDYPIGNSRTWLPKAIEEDGLVVRPLLETPQARVLQVSPPERLTALQPLR